MGLLTRYVRWCLRPRYRTASRNFHTVLKRLARAPLQGPTASLGMYINSGSIYENASNSGLYLMRCMPHLHARRSGTFVLRSGMFKWKRARWTTDWSWVGRRL